MPVPAVRIAGKNHAPLRGDGEYVLYWMIAARRTRHSFGLERAIDLALELGRPLVVLEALRLGYRWASDRLHAFVIEGMADNAERFSPAPVTHLPFIERSPNQGKGLLEALAARACLVVTDEAPIFFLPRMVAVAAERLPVRLEAVDSNGLLPLRATDRDYPTAYAFRRVLQRQLPAHLGQRPAADPLAGLELPAPARLPRGLRKRWPPASRAELAAPRTTCAALPIDHEVTPVGYRGGERAGREAMTRFIEERLPRYAQGRNHPDDEVSSGLSPWLHFGHVAADEVFGEIAACEGWSQRDLGESARGQRLGWWGMGEGAEGFLDQLVTWRELGLNVAFHREDHARYESLPGWARETLQKHARDRRPHTYSLEQLQQARTQDEIWNASQRQLLAEGRIHNYLRMVWGKKILQWTATPREALEVMIELNDRWAVDGRDPSSYSGIFWVLGRHDRPWGPERPIFGKVRYMSTAATRKKLHLRRYLQRWAGRGDE